MRVEIEVNNEIFVNYTDGWGKTSVVRYEKDVLGYEYIKISRETHEHLLRQAGYYRASE